MKPNRTQQLDDLMDRLIFDLLDAETETRVREKIEDDPEWQLAYEKAVTRKRVLTGDVRQDANAAEDRPLASAADVLSAERERKQTTRRRLLKFSSIPAAMAAAAMVMFAVSAYYQYYAVPPQRVLRVLGQNEQLGGATASLVATVSDHEGNRQANVPVELALKGPSGQVHALARWTTDQKGVAAGTVNMPDWPTDTYTLVARTPDADLAHVEVPIRITRGSKVFLSTDKPIYQPGQTIHMRLMALANPTHKPRGGAAATLTVTDPAGNLISRDELTLSEYGIASADLPLDTQIAPGRYRIKADVAGVVSEQTVEVFHYKLPAFNVAVSTDKPYYLPGQTVTGTVRARYHFGKPVTEGEVELYLADYALSEENVLEKLTLKTDSDGQTRFEVKLPDTLVAHKRTAGNAELTLTARVTDTARQEYTGSRDVQVAPQDIRVAVVVENGVFTQGLQNRVFLVTSYPDGRPAKTRLRIEEFVETLQTDDAGVAVAHIDQVPDRLTIVAVDEKGRNGRKVYKVGSTVSEGMILRTDKPTYTAGETASLDIRATSGGDVYVDVMQGERAMLTRVVTLQKGQAQLALDLPADLSGTLRLHAYRLDRKGEWMGRDVLIVVKPADELKVDVTQDRDVYRPGDEATLRFLVTTRDGSPSAAALSLAGVDEAVFSVHPMLGGLGKILRGLDEELLRGAIEVHGFTPLLLHDEDYARAILSAAAPAPTSRSMDDTPPLEDLRYLVERGLIGEDVLNQDNWPALRLQLRRRFADNPDLKKLFPPRFVQAVEMAPNARFSLGADNELAAIREYNQREETATERTETFSQTGIFLLIVAGCVLLATLAVTLLGLRPFTVAVVLVLAGIVAASVLLPSLSEVRYLTSHGAEGEMVLTAAKMEAMGQRVESQAGWQRPTAENRGFYGSEILKTGASAAQPGDNPGENAPARTRSDFPETLLWKPQLIAGPDGQAVLRLPLADSITTWRITGSAVSSSGVLGTVETGVKVHQPFFLDVDTPQTLTVGDEASLPVVLYNYTGEPITVNLTASARNGLSVTDDVIEPVSLQPGQVLRTLVPIQASAVGRGEIRVEGRAGQFADAVRRPIDVVAEGIPQTRVTSGAVTRASETITVTIPDHAQPGSIRVGMKIYPSTFSELLDGLEGIFRMPHGCFEQTSSTTYPNVMALAYMKAHKLGNAAVLAKADRYVQLGYQRLLTFENRTAGGFGWWPGGKNPNPVLTAYGLMEFADMAKVRTVDPALLDRTVKYLAKHQKQDGSWQFEKGGFHEPFTGGDNGPLPITAYITWAIAHRDASHSAALGGAGYVAKHIASADRPHTLALCINALAAVEPSHPSLKLARSRLAGMAGRIKEGRAQWGTVSATALSILALRKENTYHRLATEALTWLTEKRDSHGTWGSTHPTILAFKAILAASTAPQRRDKPAVFSVIGPDGDTRIGQLTVRPENSDVVHRTWLTGLDRPGTYRLQLLNDSGEGMGWQIATHYRSTAAMDKPTQPAPVSVSVDYDRTNLAIGQSVAVTATVRNDTAANADMPLIDIGTPPGFVVRAEGLEKLVQRGVISRYTITARGVIVYMDTLPARSKVTLTYEMVPTMPIRAIARPISAQPYYKPEEASHTAPATFTVVES
jgi:alpha-2-macroglobulin-like protein